MTVLCRVEDIHTYYGDSHVLHGVSVAVEAGTCVSILGRNGVGKSTLARSIIGFTPPRKGRIVFDGLDITGRSPSWIVRHGVALVPQGRRIFPSLTVEENLSVAVQSVRPGPRIWTKEAVLCLFPRLKERLHHRGSQLSGGEQQMLAIGRALLTNPKLLILDEPTEGLAPRVIDDLLEALKGLREVGVSLLLAEQRVQVVLALADRVYTMVNRGQIVFDGTPSEFQAAQDVQEHYLGLK